MLRSFSELRVFLFSISTQEASSAKRGFPITTSHAQEKLELSARTFVRGYNMALAEGSDLETLVPRLENIEKELQGFAFEGAGMGLALLDYFTPWQKRLPAFLSTAQGNAHIYMLHVGAGWTLGRLPQSYTHFLARYDPLLRWLALDGYGFHEGFFAWQRSFLQHARPQRLSGYALRAFDQGLGRSLWFVHAANTEHIVATIRTFPPERQPDLWSGIGLACAYAGGVAPQAIQALKDASQEYWPHLAQGCAFAAKARQRAGNPTTHTNLACTILCGVSASAAAQVTDLCLANLPQSAAAFETWRTHIRQHFAAQKIQQTAINNPLTISSTD
jgi:enediyne biosynthesis protein E3